MRWLAKVPMMAFLRSAQLPTPGVRLEGCPRPCPGWSGVRGRGSVAARHSLIPNAFGAKSEEEKPKRALPNPLLLNHRDGLNLHQIIRTRQASDDEQCARGGIGRKALLTDLPNGGGIVEIGDIRRCLHNIVECATYGLDGGLQVMPYLSGLGFGVTFAHNAAIRGSAHLASNVGSVADLDHVRIAAWLRHSVGIHICFAGHTGSFLA